jgi:anion transporter
VPLPPPARAALVVLPAIAVAALPTPEGLSAAGQRVLAVVALAIALWGSEALPAGVTALLVVGALAATGAVPSAREALAGFADPTPYFLLGVLAIGLAVSRSGLAERVAHLFLGRAGGRPRALYGQLLAAFPLLTLLLPSATTRTGILVHVYDHALELASVPRGAPLAKAVMLALNSVNRLASTILLTGGITPLVASGLIGGISWTRWLVLMSVPYLVLLAAASAIIYLQYRRGFTGSLEPPAPRARVPLSGPERRTLLVLGGASLLWLTDGVHHLHAAVPAVLAWAVLLMPRVGVLAWAELERQIGWASFFVIGSSLSLAQALTKSGAGAWVAGLLVGGAPSLAARPLAVVGLLLVASAVVRLIIPNIAGFLATTIPLGMSIGAATGTSPLVCALVVTIAGDAVLYYPAQSSSSLTVYERGHLTAGEIFRFGVLMTAVAAAVVVAVALPYWAFVGEPLAGGLRR